VVSALIRASLKNTIRLGYPPSPFIDRSLS
jgi:hypothetical protein